MTLEEMRRAKQDKGYTMAQLSELSGVPLGTLQKIFNGETAHPRYQTRQAIEKVLRGSEAEVWEKLLRSSDPEDGKRGLSSPEAGSGGDVLTEEDHFYINYMEDLPQPDYVREPATFYSVQRQKREKRQGEYTVEDYYALPRDQRVELIDGVIYRMEAPGFVHQRIAAVLLSRISVSIQEKGGGCIPLTAPLDVRLDCDDKTMVQPDLVILCDKDKIKRWGIMGAPDFVLEVISGSTRKKDYTKKLQKYADAGVREYWIVDPDKRMLVTYNFINWDIPLIMPLKGEAGLAIYDGEITIDLDEIAGLIQEWPE